MQCRDNFLLSTLSSSQISTCSQLQLIPFCARYNINPFFSQSTYQCEQCQDLYFLSNNQCQLTTIVASCLSYELDRNACSQCDSGFVLIGNQCVPNPTGVPFCRTYSSVSQCDNCDTNYFLSNGFCLQVPTENLIDNCEFYSDAVTCSQCFAGFLLLSNACPQITALNCLTAQTTSVCASCQLGFVLTTQPSGAVDCVQVNIPFCASFDTQGNCLRCQSGFYLNNNQCLQVTQTVQNCFAYGSATLCSQCDQGFVLVLNGNLCSPFGSTQANELQNCFDAI